MRKKSGIFFILFMVLSGCSRPQSDEELLRKIALDVAEASQDKDIKGIMSRISKDFSDDKGNNYDSIKGLLLYQFMRAEKVSIFVRDIDVEVRGDRAVIDARIVAVRGKKIEKITDVLPEGSSILRFSVVFGKENKEWKALSAIWDEAGALGVL